MVRTFLGVFLTAGLLSDFYVPYFAASLRYAMPTVAVISPPAVLLFNRAALHLPEDSQRSAASDFSH